MPSQAFQCPQCRKKFQTAVDDSTTIVTCPGCQNVIFFDRQSAAPADDAPLQLVDAGTSEASELDLAPLEGGAGENGIYQLAPDEPAAASARQSGQGFTSAAAGQQALSPAPAVQPGKKQLSFAEREEKKKRRDAQRAADEQRRNKLFMIVGACSLGGLLLISICGGLIALATLDIEKVAPDIAEAQREYQTISEGNFVVFDKAPENVLLKGERANSTVFSSLAKATVLGPEADGESAAWKPLESRSPRAAPPDPRPLSSLPVAWNDTHFLTTESASERRSRNSVKFAVWQIHDLQSGLAAGEKISLGELELSSKAQSATVLALSPDSKWVVGTDYADGSRVRVWSTTGAEQAGFVPVTGEPAKWLGFNADGQLLTLCGKTLCGWSFPECASRWRVEFDETAFVVPNSHLDWLAVGHGAAIDLIDAATGKRRGRLQHDGAEMVIDIAIAPQENQLAAVYLVDAIEQAHKNQPARLAIWDLHKGAAKELALSPMLSPHPLVSTPKAPHVRTLFWIDNDKVVFQQRAPELPFRMLSANGCTVLPLFTKFTGQRGTATDLTVHAGPYDRLWAHGSGDYYPVVFLGDETDEHRLVKDVLEGFEGADAAESVCLEIDAGDEARSRVIATQAASQLAEEGIGLSKNGLRLRATFAAEPGNESLQFGNQEYIVPRVNVVWECLDQQGKSLWSETYGRSWNPLQTQYKVGRRHHTGTEEVQYYKFPGRPRLLMVDEVMSRKWEIPDKAIARLKQTGGESLPEMPRELAIASPTVSQLHSNDRQMLSSQGIGSDFGAIVAAALPRNKRVLPNMAFSPDGKLLHVPVIGDSAWRLLTLDLAQRVWREPRELTGTGNRIWSPTFDLAAFIESRRVEFGDPFDAGVKTATLTMEDLGVRIVNVGLSAHGDYAYLAGRSALGVFDLATSEKILELPQNEAGATAAFSADGSHAAAAGEEILLWKLDGAELLGKLPLPKEMEFQTRGRPFKRTLESAPEAIVLSDDGGRLAALHREYGTRIYLYSGAAGEPHVVQQDEHEFEELAMDRAGRFIAYRGKFNSNYYIHLYSCADQSRVRSWNVVGQYARFAFHPTGNYLAIATHGKVTVYDIKTSQFEWASNPRETMMIAEPAALE